MEAVGHAETMKEGAGVVAAEAPSVPITIAEPGGVGVAAAFVVACGDFDGTDAAATATLASALPAAVPAVDVFVPCLVGGLRKK